MLVWVSGLLNGLLLDMEFYKGLFRLEFIVVFVDRLDWKSVEFWLFRDMKLDYGFRFRFCWFWLKRFMLLELLNWLF